MESLGQCEAMNVHGNFPDWVSTRCPNEATVLTEYESVYCEEHKDFDE